MGEGHLWVKSCYLCRDGPSAGLIPPCGATGMWKLWQSHQHLAMAPFSMEMSSKWGTPEAGSRDLQVEGENLKESQ